MGSWGHGLLGSDLGSWGQTWEAVQEFPLEIHKSLPSNGLRISSLIKVVSLLARTYGKKRRILGQPPRHISECNHELVGRSNWPFVLRPRCSATLFPRDYKQHLWHPRPASHCRRHNLAPERVAKPLEWYVLYNDPVSAAPRVRSKHRYYPGERLWRNPVHRYKAACHSCPASSPVGRQFVVYVLPDKWRRPEPRYRAHA